MKTFAGMNVGDVFGMLTLISTEGACASNSYKCVFECACGKVKEIRAHNVKRGRVKSCGCARLETLKNGRQSSAKEYRARSRFGGKEDLSLKKFVKIFNGIEDPDSIMTCLGVMKSKTAKYINRHGCARYPAIFCCVFISGRDGHSEATRKTGFSNRSAREYAKQHPDVYAAGLQARAERETSSRPAPPQLPVNTSVDF